MVARCTGASLALLAFAVTLIAGLYARNPTELVLTRGILALFLFFFIGYVLGSAAQRVVHETARSKETEFRHVSGREGESEPVPNRSNVPGEDGIAARALKA